VSRFLRTKLVVVVGVVCVLGSPRATADPRFATSVSRERIEYPGTWSVTYSLRVETGDSAERFSVAAELPVLEVAGGGAPLQIKRFVLEGAGAVLGRRSVTATPGCAPSAPGLFHGYEPESEGLSVALPANSESTLKATYEARAFAFWPGVDLDLRFRLGRPYPEQTAGPGTVGLPRVFKAAGPSVVRRRSGIRIDLQTSPASSYQSLARAHRIHRGRRITIRGQLHPAVPGQRVRLAWYGPGSSHRLATIGFARSRRNGRFTLSGWRPRRLGTYELWAFVRPSTKEFVADHRCPRVFRLIR